VYQRGKVARTKKAVSGCVKREKDFQGEKAAKRDRAKKETGQKVRTVKNVVHKNERCGASKKIVWVGMVYQGKRNAGKDRGIHGGGKKEGGEGGQRLENRLLTSWTSGKAT